MASTRNYLVKGFRSGVIPLIIFISILSTVLLLGSVGYYIFPTSIVEGKVIELSRDARSNRTYKVVYKVGDKEYTTFGLVRNGDIIKIGQSCSIIYYDYFPFYSKTTNYE